MVVYGSGADDGQCRMRQKKPEGLSDFPYAKQLSQGIPAAAFSCWLKDRYNVEFPVWVNCRHCTNTIYNSVPLSLHQYLAEQKRRGIRAIRLDFTDETAEKTREVLEFFSEGKGTAPAQYTTGHYKKGVQ